MKIKIVTSAQKLTEEDITQAEQRLGCSIPTVYRSFLLSHNGGRPKPNVFTIPGKNGRPDDESYLHTFLGINTGEFDSDLEEHVKMFRNRIPSNFLPIANDDLGNLICMSTQGADTGSIYFWDHELETPEGKLPTYNNVYILAKNFDDFLNGLHEDT